MVSKYSDQYIYGEMIHDYWPPTYVDKSQG